MSDTLDRMRRLQALRPQKSKPELTYTPIDDDGNPQPRRTPPPRGRLEELLPGVDIVNPAGTCYVTTTSFALSEVRGGAPLAATLDVTPAVLAPFHPDFKLEAGGDFAEAAFIDTETTGLGAGAGVYAFLVGVGTFERWPAAPAYPLSPHTVAPAADAVLGPVPVAPTHFVVRQFFMRHPGEEAAMLAAIAEAVALRRLVVTFNGRGFDLPLLRARYRQQRALLPPACRHVALFDEGSPHLDLLLPARRLWRRRLQSCRLLNLERTVLGVMRTEEDVPGAEIPALYLDFLRTQQAGAMRRVFYHNCEDIVSMVALGNQLLRAYVAARDADDAGLYGEDLFALATCFARQGEAELAERAYRRAAQRAADDRLRAEVFAAWALLLKRQARWEEAADLWQLWLTSVNGGDALPYIELAKHHEWRTGDLEQAEMWAAWGVHTVETMAISQRLPGQLADLHHRLARIQRKRRSTAPGVAGTA